MTEGELYDKLGEANLRLFDLVLRFRHDILDAVDPGQEPSNANAQLMAMLLLGLGSWLKQHAAIIDQLSDPVEDN